MPIFNRGKLSIRFAKSQYNRPSDIAWFRARQFFDVSIYRTVINETKQNRFQILQHVCIYTKIICNTRSIVVNDVLRFFFLIS